VETNNIFHLNDPHPEEFHGYPVPEGWWSRRYEYAWAAQWQGFGETVVDMGYGYFHRPFKNFLCNHAEIVYGIDARPSNEPKLPHNFVPLVEDFTTQTSLPDNSMDQVYCLSVLEDTNHIDRALVEFKRVLTPGGLIVLTFDIPYDSTKPPHDKYKGVAFGDFYNHVENAGLRFRGKTYLDYKDAVFNEEFNLCVYHALLEIA
jgi:SAM-dependent methyltransferase